MQIIRDIPLLRQAVATLPKPVCFVPTMGALHAGHLALVEAAKKEGGSVVVSIFVNPTQFAPGEDFDAYPRIEAQDLALLEEISIDIAYLPSVQTMYPQGKDRQIGFNIGNIGSVLCGKSRPHFFDGVVLVVTKLFNQVQPDKAFFGEKDYQQLLVIQTCVQELDLPIEVVAVPIVREVSGLALSSRNQYLNEAEQHIAPELYKTLCWVKEHYKTTKNIALMLENAKETLLAKGFGTIDYLTICDAKTLTAIDGKQPNARLFVAATLGQTRLIDTLSLS